VERPVVFNPSATSQPETKRSEQILAKLAESSRDMEPMPSAFAALRTAARAVTQFYDLVLAPTGLKATQFIILQAIRSAGEIAQCDFAREFGIAVPTLSRRFGGLRRKELIQIRRGERHGERIYSLTPKGETAFNMALPYWERAQRRLRTAMGEEDWCGILQLSARIRNAAINAEQLRTANQDPSTFCAAADLADN
jgi:DNA-binding MarR family transcriptional regulator